MTTIAQTQLASMFIGSFDGAPDDYESHVRSQTGGAIIHIADGQTDKTLDFITAKNIIDDTHEQSLESYLETYDFRTFADKRFSQYLSDKNRVIIPDEDSGFKEFIIRESSKYRDTEGLKYEVFAVASYQELRKSAVIKPTTLNDQTGTSAIAIATQDTDWVPGIIESKGTRSFRIEQYTNPFSFLKRIAKEFEVELNFRVETNGRMVTGRYVDLLVQTGTWRGREIEFGRDLKGIRRTEKTDNVVTALLGIGPEQDNGKRNEVLVEDGDALQRWGRPDKNTRKLKHLIEVYEPQSTRQDMTISELRQYTQTELNKRINAVVEFESEIVDLEHVPGMQNKKMRFGDTIKIKDRGFNPPLYLETRVFNQKRSIVDKSKKTVKLGDYIEYTEEEVNAIYKMLLREIKKKIDLDKLEEYAEPKKIESDTPPEIAEGENPIWVDTSKTPKVPHVVVAGEWVKMSPTTPAEVDAYTKQQVDNKDNSTLNTAKKDATDKADAARTAAEKAAAEDALKKAEQSLADAKAFAENADNISKGVIDVGAIPLRTSVTGARLEWDGLNGLIQYDRDGNPVAWLDLEANAHFANAFLSGEIHALKGYLGDGNVIIDSDGVKFIRPDGAISMINGITNDGYTVSGNDPHYMKRGENITNDHIFNAFNSDADSWYRAIKGELDGRGVPGWDINYKDVRDKNSNAMVFQRYEFIHSARYVVFGYQNAGSSGTHSIHIFSDSSDNLDKRVYFEKLDASHSGNTNFIVDLGKPNFQRKELYLKIAWVHSWGPREDTIQFRMQRIIQTDNI